MNTESFCFLQLMSAHLIRVSKHQISLAGNLTKQNLNKWQSNNYTNIINKTKQNKTGSYPQHFKRLPCSSGKNRAILFLVYNYPGSIHLTIYPQQSVNVFGDAVSSPRPASNLWHLVLRGTWKAGQPFKTYSLNMIFTFFPPYFDLFILEMHCISVYITCNLFAYSTDISIYCWIVIHSCLHISKHIQWILYVCAQKNK